MWCCGSCEGALASLAAPLASCMHPHTLPSAARAEPRLQQVCGPASQNPRGWLGQTPRGFCAKPPGVLAGSAERATNAFLRPQAHRGRHP